MRGKPFYRVRVDALGAKLKYVLTAPPVADVLIYDKDGKLVRRLDGRTKREKPVA